MLYLRAKEETISFLIKEYHLPNFDYKDLVLIFMYPQSFLEFIQLLFLWFQSNTLCRKVFVSENEKRLGFFAFTNTEIFDNMLKEVTMVC